ncbi:hypothetical protein H920_08787 [Fukomys damarensis]|uniref:Uncharacterized protein n=1 Tax=Fukomys damarensis TaxID=885580 RepID=A0A091DHQ5_FUKDA|nr:hypothetical protein H920_08787 [Fukomys damarensis]
MKRERKRKYLEPSLLKQPEKGSREKLDLQEDDLQGINNVVTPTQEQKESNISSANHFSCEDKFLGADVFTVRYRSAGEATAEPWFEQNRTVSHDMASESNSPVLQLEMDRDGEESLNWILS